MIVIWCLYFIVYELNECEMSLKKDPFRLIKKVFEFTKQPWNFLNSLMQMPFNKTLKPAGCHFWRQSFSFQIFSCNTVVPPPALILDFAF